MASSPSDPPPPTQSLASREAASWLWRIDRGLMPAEQDQFLEWLAAHPENAATMDDQRRLWRRLDHLADWRPEHGARPNPDLLAPRHRQAWQGRLVAFTLAAAACLALAGTVWVHTARDPVEVSLPAHENRQVLPDQSSAKLNHDSRITILFSDSERRVRLDHGEAFFIVKKDAARPFVVEVGNVDVRAVGTAFNVQFDGSGVQVLVAEGVVEVSRDMPVVDDLPAPNASLRLSAQQHLSIPLTPDAPPSPIATLDHSDIRRSLAWQHGLMTFHEKPLGDIVAELNRLNDTQLVLMDNEMGSIRFSGTIRSDNLAGFARLLASGFGARIERESEQEIWLRTRGKALSN